MPTQPTPKINRTKFYNNVKQLFFNGKLSQVQVDNFEDIINEWECGGYTDLRWLGYILGTIYHETAKTIQPIEEYGKGKGKKYGKRVKMDGTPYKETAIFYGRGHTQNSWYDNYLKLTKQNDKGWDFLNHPELLLTSEPSIWATFHSMTTGLYTGKKLSDYFDNKILVSHDDMERKWIWARSIINGKNKGETLPDKAELIADYSKKFYTSLL